MSKLTDAQYTCLRSAILNELYHFAEEAGDVDMYADAIMALIDRALNDDHK